MVHWPWWGPWKCTVVHYDAQGRWVNLSDGWSETRMFPIAEVWLNAPRARNEAGSVRRRLYAKLLGAGVGIGVAIGAALTALLGG
jgi:hypothetical protein